MLTLYGNIACLLDATHNVTRYDMPLFLLCVRTNVGHVVVATFLLMDEKSSSIQTALEMIKQWNPEWNPPHFVSDYCEAQISALEAVFPGNMLPE